MKNVAAFQRLDSGKYQENHGLYYDEFEIGDIIVHKPGRTVTETDNMWQSMINMNNHPLHIDYYYAEQTEFKKPLVSSLVTLSIIGGMCTNGTSAKAIANLGWKEINLSNPVFIGDTLYAETEVIDMRLSKSRLNTGIVTFKTTGFNQQGLKVMCFIRMALIPTSNYGK
jgi:itaconyl-CoA hydratase